MEYGVCGVVGAAQGRDLDSDLAGLVALPPAQVGRAQHDERSFIAWVASQCALAACYRIGQIATPKRQRGQPAPCWGQLSIERNCVLKLGSCARRIALVAC